MKKTSLLVLFVLLLLIQSKAQDNYLISGRIHDSTNAQSLAGAVIKIKGSHKTVIANTDGSFEIKAGYMILKDKLGQKGASTRAADLMIGYLRNSSGQNNSPRLNKPESPQGLVYLLSSMFDGNGLLARGFRMTFGKLDGNKPPRSCAPLNSLLVLVFYLFSFSHFVRFWCVGLNLKQLIFRKQLFDVFLSKKALFSLKSGNSNSVLDFKRMCLYLRSQILSTCMQ